MNHQIKSLCMAMMMPFMAVGQSTTQIADLRTVPFKEWSTKNKSIDKKGKYWTVLYVAELKTRDGRSTNEDVKVHYTTEHPQLQKQAEWFKWSPLDQCWVKYAKPGIKKDDLQIQYELSTNLPGIYSLMMPQKSMHKGIAVRVPKGYAIEQVSIKQNEPAISMDLKPKKKTRNLELPLNDLQFDAKIEVFLINKKKERFTLNRLLAGNFVDFRKIVTAQQQRELIIGSEFITQYEADTVPLSNR